MTIVLALVAAILGALAGAFCATAGTWWLSRQAENRAVEGAARLVWEEQLRNLVILAAARRSAVAGRKITRTMSFDQGAWRKHSTVLVLHLDREVFAALASAYFLQQLVEVQMRGFADTLLGRAGEIIDQAFAATKAALDGLAPVGGLGPEAAAEIAKIDAEIGIGSRRSP